MNEKQLLSDLTSKNTTCAMVAIEHMVNNKDCKLYSLLADKFDSLYDFVQDNFQKRLNKIVNSKNYLNLLEFFKYYSFNLDKILIESLLKFANQDLTDIIYGMLETGNEVQKTYCAKYFEYIPDTVAIDLLRENAFSDYEPLSINCSLALRKMNDDIFKNKLIELLNSNDDFESLKAIKLLTNFADENILNKLFQIFQKSKLKENIAGEIIYFKPIFEIIKRDYIEGIIYFNSIIDGLGEILSISELYNYQIYEVLNYLIENKPNDIYACNIILKTKNKISDLYNNEEYIYDESKEIKDELKNIFELLNNKSSEFYNEKKRIISKNLKESKDLLLTALENIKNYKITSSKENLISLLTQENDIIKTEIVHILKEFGYLNNINKEELLKSIKNNTLKVIVENDFF